MISTVALIVAALSLVVSAGTMYLSLLRRGRVRITQPTILFLGYDTGSVRSPKVYLRALLYSSAHRGIPIENMFVTLVRGETRQTFNIWVHGEERLARGSGLFVPREGVVVNHHFLLPKDGSDFRFLAGAYALEVFVTFPGSVTPVLLHVAHFPLTDKEATHLERQDAGIYLDWAPNLKAYQASLDVRKPKPNDFLDALRTIEIERLERNPLG